MRLQLRQDVLAGWPASSWLKAALQPEAAVTFLDTDAMAGAYSPPQPHPAAVHALSRMVCVLGGRRRCRRERDSGQ